MTINEGMTIRTAISYGVLIAALALTAWVYWPGLNGIFLLDDYNNLRMLDVMGGVHDATDVLNFILEGRSGPGGRPLSLLSFLANDNAWPTSAWSFKYTNLMLHLLNGVLVAWLSLKLMAALDVAESQREVLAVTVAALWMLHPLNVSTVLYVIQRMTQLSATFVLAALICYVHGRAVAGISPRRGYAWMGMGIGFGGILAVLSKETGALLPLFALSSEFLLLRRRYAVPRSWYVYSGLFLWGPVVAAVGWITINWTEVAKGYEIRNYTLTERLLTEACVVTDYIRLVVIPRLQGTGLLIDSYPVSRGLLQAPETLASVLFLGFLLALAILVWRRLPVLTFGILWFLAGHLLESTVLPLELYFEHRNYLPLVGPIFAFAYFTSYLLRRRIIFATLLASACALLAAVSWAQASLWGEPLALAELWTTEQPRSVRARQMAANAWLYYRHDPDAALKHLQAALRHNPDTAGLRLQILQVHCLNDEVAAHEVETVRLSLRDDESDTGAEDQLFMMDELRKQGACRGIDREQLLALAAAIIDNPSTPLSAKSNMNYLRGKLYREAGHLNEAVEALTLAYEAEPDIDIALAKASWLVEAGLYEQARVFVDKARGLDSRGRWPLANRRKRDIDWWNAVIDDLQGRSRATAGATPAE